MSYYDLYGFDDPDIRTARRLVEQALGVALQPRNSDYAGSYFLLRDEAGDLFTLHTNYNEEEGELREPDFAKHPVVLYITNSTLERVEGYQRKLLANAGIYLLSREDL